MWIWSPAGWAVMWIAWWRMASGISLPPPLPVKPFAGETYKILQIRRNIMETWGK